MKSNKRHAPSARSANLALVLLAFLGIAHASPLAAQDDSARVEAIRDRADAAYAAGRLDDLVPLAHQLVVMADRGNFANPNARSLYRQLGSTYLAYSANTYLIQKKYDQALDAGLRARSSLELLYGANHDKVADCFYSIGSAYYHKADYAKAINYFDAALGIYAKNHGDVHDLCRQAVDFLAYSYREAGQYEKAIAAFERERRIVAGLSGANSDAIAQLLHRLGDCRWNNGDRDAANADYQAAFELRARILGPDHADTLYSAAELASGMKQVGRMDEAARLYELVANGRARTLGADHADTIAARGAWTEVVGQAADDQTAAGDYAAALETRKKILRDLEASGASALDLASALDNLGYSHWNAGDLKSAKDSYARSLALRVAELGEDDAWTLYSRWLLARVKQADGQTEEANAELIAILADRQRALGADHADTADSLCDVAAIRAEQKNFTEAERLYKQALTAREKQLGEEHLAVATCLYDLALLYINRGRSIEAQPLLARAANLREKLEADRADTLAAIAYLGTAYFNSGNYRQAEEAYRRQLAFAEQSTDPADTEAAYALTNIGSTLQEQGRYDEAEPYFRRALDLRQARLPADHADVAYSLDNLGILFRAEKRYAEAEKLHRQSLAIWEKQGPSSSGLANAINNVANVLNDQGLFEQEEPLRRRAIDLWREVNGNAHTDVAIALGNYALLLEKTKRFDEAIANDEEALAVAERALGPEHPELPGYLAELGRLYLSGGQLEKGEPILDRAVTLAERPGVKPRVRFDCYINRARLAWGANRRTEALSDLRRAMDIAEQQRSGAGAEQDRAAFFSQFAAAFELMVEYQAELGDAAETLAAIERLHARSLVDELSLAGADLGIGRAPSEREALAAQETEIQAEIAELETRLATAADLPQSDRARLESDLEAARTRLYQHYRDARSTSPVYRDLLASNAGPPRLGQLQRMIGENSRLYIYMTGQESCFLLAIGHDQASVTRLVVDEAGAKALGIESGPLTAERLQSVMHGATSDGLIADLADAERALAATPKLAALYAAIVPKEERQAIAEKQFERLFIVPDGSLATLPFEALVVEPGATPIYLLDVGPPIQYAPSATVLNALNDRRGDRPPDARESILTVGDPAYPTAGATPDTEAGERSLAKSRFSTTRTTLSRLPFTAQESTWVAETFRRVKADVVALRSNSATEAGVRSRSAGRQLIHLACHGLTDQSFGNLFGALALTPGPRAAEDRDDDGFLTLAEIYELDLRACDLAILSACETNFGPRQQGEGVWALSRGFLVAGAKRVVASNWLVDDEASANLISYFCGGVVKQDGLSQADYARDLHAAKRWIRQQEKWRSPYYWATFVLIGPR